MRYDLNANDKRKNREISDMFMPMRASREFNVVYPKALSRVQRKKTHNLVVVASVLRVLVLARNRKSCYAQNIEKVDDMDVLRDDSFTRPDGYPTRTAPIGSTRTRFFWIWIRIWILFLDPKRFGSGSGS